jgi:serine/threonine protein phosphatase 1
MGRIWVIPDSHGCLKTMRVLVEDQIHLRRNDKLYFLGDYIDRGPDSKGLIDYIMQLAFDGYDVTAIKGNHEDFMVKVWEEANHPWSFGNMINRRKIYKEWFESGGDATMQSFGTSDMKLIPAAYIDWIKSLPLFVELEKYVLVHAGFNFDADNIFLDEQAMMWARDYSIVPEKVNFRRIIHGHVPVPLDFIEAGLHSGTFQFIALDNGVYMLDRPGFGNLTALELSSLELLIQPNLDM